MLLLWLHFELSLVVFPTSFSRYRHQNQDQKRSLATAADRGKVTFPLDFKTHSRIALALFATALAPHVRASHLFSEKFGWIVTS